MVTADPIDFSALQAIIDGKQKKQTPQVLTAINVLQLIVPQAPNLCIALLSDAGIQPLDGGLELWRGYFQSVCPTAGQVLVNVDVSTAVMFKQGSFQSAALAVLKQRDGVSITLVHRPGLKKIRGLVPNAGNYEFENTTVKGRQIEYPNIIGIQVGSQDRDEVIPAEMCVIAPDQRYIRKLPPEFSSFMVKFSSKNPQDRMALISAGINNHVTADQRSTSHPVVRSSLFLFRPLM
ncbi:hypothetical protein P692DRAFT_20879776 [Suillus brevipes Sb2]|nr:hypothetical protein P692DRAFT_20879776 [Suillus brevipes Sb2]